MRVATEDDLQGLLDLERAANLAGLRHVFAPDRHPFPDDDVLARWALVLEEPGARVLVADSPDGGRLDVLAAHDASSLRHLAVHPDRWGTGLATAAVAEVVATLEAAGVPEVDLWCLDLNHRARRLYERLGWRPTRDSRPAPWPPHPVERRHTRPLRPAA